MRSVVLALALVGSILACGGGQGVIAPTQFPAQPTTAPVGGSEATATSTEAPAPPAAAVPADTPSGAQTSTPLAPTQPPMLIQIAPGDTSAEAAGGFGTASGSNVPDTYVLSATAGEAVTVTLTTTSGGQPLPSGAYLHLWGADGTELAPASLQATTWQGTLPSTQDYYIEVIDAAQIAIKYTLDVTIAPAQ